MKAPLFLVLSILFFSATLYSCSGVVGSAEDGQDPIPRGRYVFQTLACLAAGCVCVKVALANADNRADP